MKLSKTKKNNQTLTELHTISHLIESHFFGQKILTEDFSSSVKQEMERIRKEHLNINIEEWGAKCKTARLNSGFSQEKVAEKLHVNHSMLVRQENVTGKSKVNLFYLEAFSLLYHLRPLTLLGIQSQTLNIVTTFNNVLAFCYQNIIINSLYTPENPNTLYFLHMISRIGNLKYSAEMALITVLNQLPVFKDIFRKDPRNHPMGNSRHWMTLTPGILDYSKIQSKEYAISFVYYEAFVTTSNLIQQNDISKLEWLAQLALAKPCHLKLLADICYIGGITNNPRSLKPISLEPFTYNAPAQGDITPKYPIQFTP